MEGAEGEGTFLLLSSHAFSYPLSEIGAFSRHSHLPTEVQRIEIWSQVDGVGTAA